MTAESALVVLIPEANGLLEEFRKRYNLPVAGNLPAHVTILYPFKSPKEFSEGLIEKLRRLFRKQPVFTVSFKKIQCFPDMMYLAPMPAEPFRRLTEIVASRFPDTPPYGGAFDKIVPHLTIAQADTDHPLDKIAADFKESVRDILPIHAKVETVTLMVNSGDFWELDEEFLLDKTRRGA